MLAAQPKKKIFSTVLIALITLIIVGLTTGTGQSFGKHSTPSAPQNANVSPKAQEQALLPGARHAIRSSENGIQSRESMAELTQPSASLFSRAVNYDSGGIVAYSVAVGDVNGDGKQDIVVANGNESNGDGSVGVLLGNGDGTFRSAVTYDSGATFSDFVVIADVNGDGQPDLVVANTGGGVSGNGSVGVLLGNGDGTFRAAMTYDSGGRGPDSVAVADVNLDGKSDVLVANACFGISNCTSGSVAVLLGNGDGTFQQAVIYNDGGLFPRDVVVADVNGDGKPDMVVASLYPFSFEADSVGVRLGNGDGTFQSESFYGMGGTNGASSVVAADVNLDGKLDLVFVNDHDSFGANIGVLLGNGDGTFRPVKTYSSHGSETGGPGLAVVDVDGDGNPDLLVADFAGYCTPNCGGAVDVLLGNGNGTFRSVVSYSSGAYGAQSVAVGDLNGDGKPDVVLANQDPSPFGGPGTVAVLLQRARTSTSLTSSLNPSIYGQKVTWTATVTSSGSITPTGRVNFTWDGYSIGSATLNASGVATLTKSNLNADPYPLTAAYSGDVNNLRSTSAIVNQVVTETTSAAKITSTPNPSTLGQAVTFMATITSPTVIPTGPVTFMVGTKVLGTAQLSSGKAKFTTSTLPVGSIKVTAIYYGDSNIAKSSASVIQTVQ
jgi:hypothetical protein